MGKWIAAVLILAIFVVPTIWLVAWPEQSVTDMALGWFTPKPEVALGRQYIEAVRTGNFVPVERNFERQYVTPDLPGGLARITGLFPKESPKSVRLVNVNWMLSKGSTTYNLSYEYEFPHGWMLAAIALVKTGDRILIHGLNVRPLPDSLEHINALTLRGKSRAYYVYAGAAVLVYAFWLVSVFVCLFTPMARFKWLWVIFVMLGCAGYNMNWTTGAMQFVLFNVAVPTVRAWHNFGAPWIVQIALPFGAFVFWTRRGALIDAAKAAKISDAAPDLRTA